MKDDFSFLAETCNTFLREYKLLTDTNIHFHCNLRYLCAEVYPCYLHDTTDCSFRCLLFETRRNYLTWIITKNEQWKMQSVRKGAKSEFQSLPIQQYDAFQACSAPTNGRRNLSVMSLEVRCTRFCHAADPQQYNFTTNTNTTTSHLEVAIYLSIIPNKATNIIISRLFITRLLLVIRNSLHGMAHSYSFTESICMCRRTAVHCEQQTGWQTAVCVQTEQSDTKQQVTSNLVCSLFLFSKDSIFDITINFMNHSKCY